MLLTEAFPSISFHLSVYLFLKQNDIMLRRDTHFKYYRLLVSDRKFNWEFL